MLLPPPNRILFVLFLVTQIITSSVVVAIDKEHIKSYTILPSSHITQELKTLEEKYPSLVTLSTSQRSYNLPTAGNDNDCSFDKDVSGCYNYFITIEDSLKHPKGSDSYNRLPEVLLSGALHGNERVGPTAVVETAKLLLEAAACEALPRVISTQDIDINTEEGATWLFDMEMGERCRNELLQRGISDHERKWLARLVSTRRIVVIPSANALGYDRNQRTELHIDPNRDFPYDVIDERLCMQTIAGRTLNEIFRQHMFQISLTFHAGTEVVSYEWGAPTYNGKSSPDDIAQVEIGDGYSRFAGDFQGTLQYRSGTMNALVYPVRGGMEDWAYAGSWDPDRVIQCKPDEKLHGKYDPEKTKYNDSTLRAFNMLIETSDYKVPTSHLGTSENVLNYKHSFESNGHISRNIRLSLMAIDIVQPYVSVTSINGKAMLDDVIPMVYFDEEESQKSKIIGVPEGTDVVEITWTVGGAFTVDSTSLHYASGDVVPSSINEYEMTEAKEGVTKWSKRASEKDSFTSFREKIDISKYKAGESIFVVASAKVDQGWMTEPKPNVAPKLPPMSHIVNARTNPDWLHESAGKIIQGQDRWYSLPVMITIMKDAVEVVEITNRFVIPDEKPNESHSQGGDDDSSNPLIVVIALSIAVTFTLYKVVNRCIRKYHVAHVKLSKSRGEAGRDYSFDDVFDDEIEEIQLREIS